MRQNYHGCGRAADRHKSTSLGDAKCPQHAPETYIAQQGHNNPVRDRNIWIRSLGEYDEAER